MKIFIQAPELFTTTPSLAIPKAISNASLNASQIDLYEINEAFAVCPLSDFSFHIFIKCLYCLLSISRNSNIFFLLLGCRFGQSETSWHPFGKYKHSNLT